MNLATEQTEIIRALLTYPDRTAKILAVNSHLIDCELVKRIEQISYQMKTNGSQEAAIFLERLIPRLNRIIDIARVIDAIDFNSCEPREMETFISSGTAVNSDTIQPQAIAPSATSTQQTKTQNIKASGKKRFASFSVIASILFLCLFAINHKFGLNPFTSLPQVLATDADNTTPKVSTSTLVSVEAMEIDLVESYESTRNYSGQIVAKQNSELSFTLGGQLASLEVKAGDFVTEGTPLAYLNTDTLRNQQQELLARKARAIAQLKELQAGERPETIAAAKAVVANFQGQLNLENQKRIRRASLYAEGAISREQLDEVNASVASLQARLNEAQSELNRLQAGTRPERIEAQQATIRELDANLANIKIELNKSILKAPFTGTISQRQVDMGAVVSPGQSIFNLVEDRVLEAHIGIPIDRSEEIRIGENLPLNISNNIYQAKVTSLLPELDTNTRTVTAVFSLNQQGDRRIFPRQTAQLQLTQTVAKSGFWLPIESLVRGERGLWYCYAVVQTPSEQNANQTKPIFQIERRAVEVLHSNERQVLIRGTLQPGDKVIANDIERLVAGQLVTLKISNK